MYKVSVIIVTYNSEAHIYSCLESLFKFNDIGDDLEVIVVDNCSKEFEIMNNKLISLYGNRLTIIRNDKNGGYGQGNNVGIRASHAPIIMIMNPDVRLSMPVFNVVHDKFCKDSKVVMYGMTQRDEHGNLGCSMWWVNNGMPYISEILRFILCNNNIYVPKYMYISGACFFIRKETFEEIGLFDENIFMYCEEDDIHGRLMKKKGARIVYDKQLEYIHLHPPVSDYGSQGFEWKKRSLESLIYLNQREGVCERDTVARVIKQANVSIWSERLKCMLGMGDKQRMIYFMKWRDYLKKRYSRI